MKFLDNSISMSTSLLLTEREVAMLSYFTSFGPETISRNITGNLGTRFSTDEWCKFWNEMRAELDRINKRMIDTQKVFKGQLRATRFEEPPEEQS